MKKHHKYILVALFSSSTYAGTGFYVDIVNYTRDSIYIDQGYNVDCWYPYSFDNETEVPAKTTRHLYTEMVASGSCMFDVNKQMHSNIILPDKKINMQFKFDDGYCRILLEGKEHLKESCSSSSSTIRSRIEIWPSSVALREVAPYSHQKPLS